MENEGTESLAYKRISGTHKGCPIRRERGERERESEALNRALGPFDPPPEWPVSWPAVVLAPWAVTRSI